MQVLHELGISHSGAKTSAPVLRSDLFLFRVASYRIYSRMEERLTDQSRRFKKLQNVVQVRHREKG